jgi:hypothetical protein
MGRKSFNSLVFALFFFAAPAAPTFAQTIYSVVPDTSTSSVARVEVPTPVISSQPIPFEPTTFAPSDEKLSATSYQAMFRVDPFTVLSQVASFDARSGQPKMTIDEINLFQDVQSGHASHFSFAEAALIACGVRDIAQRQNYLAQIDDITAGCRGATTNCKTTRAKSRAIMKYLLKGPMKGGYVHDQSLLSTLLETTTFNCVSSATLFNIVARRLGIEVGAVLQPGHVFSRIPGYDVQTTSGSIYSSDERVEHVRKMMDEFHHPVGGFDADRPYHETGDFGLLSAIYGNLTTEERADHDLAQAAVDSLKKSCLDSTDPTSGSKVNSCFTAWFNSSLKAGDIATASTIANLYGQIARDPALAGKMAKNLANASRQFASR